MGAAAGCEFSRKMRLVVEYARENPYPAHIGTKWVP